MTMISSHNAEYYSGQDTVAEDFMIITLAVKGFPLRVIPRCLTDVLL